jgi:hypothetical protein
MKQKIFGKIKAAKQIVGVVNPIKKLSGKLNAAKSRIKSDGGITAGYFRPSFFGSFGVAGTPVKYQRLIDSEGYLLIDKDGKILLTKEGDETLWQQ